MDKRFEKALEELDDILRRNPHLLIGHKHTTDPRLADYDPRYDPDLGCIHCEALLRAGLR